MESIIIIGGDKRQVFLKEILADKGYICEHINSQEENYNPDSLSNFDVVILPVPISKDKEHIYSDNGAFKLKIKDVITKIKGGQCLFAGSIDNALALYLNDRKVNYTDYIKCGNFAIFNAYLTAQGALRLLLCNTSEFIIGKKAIVTGFGRVAKATAGVLKNNGIKVYIAARNPSQLLEAECKGYNIINIDDISSCIFTADYIFNTVPFNIFSQEDVKRFNGKYFELASAPFGVNKDYFSDKTECYVDGAALPGKFLPLSSAKQIADITIQYLTQRNGGD